MVNTLVYNSLSRGITSQCRALVDSAIRCMHLLYERDCRREFCHPSLWLSPARNNRMPISVAARTHEAFSAADGAPSLSMGSVITTMPHVFPFDERYVQHHKILIEIIVHSHSTKTVQHPLELLSVSFSFTHSFVVSSVI